MGEKKELPKAKRISKEEKRLKESYSKIPEEVMKVVEGIIKEAAFMRVQLEIYRNDLDSNGYTELFSQSEKTEPYERERPVARLYNTMNKNYQSIIKQLSDLLPKQKPGKLGDEDDGFDEFVAKK